MAVTIRTTLTILASIPLIALVHCQNLICDPPDPAGLKPGYKVALDRDGMVRNANDFCIIVGDNNLVEQPIYRSYGPWGPNRSANFGYMTMNFTVEWDGSSCDTSDFTVADCQNTFMQIIGGCDVNTRTAKRGGAARAYCKKWLIEGVGGPDLYRLHLFQSIWGDFSELVWTMYDSRGAVLGGPSSDPHPTGAPNVLRFDVLHPTDREHTDVKIRYPLRDMASDLEWSTGSVAAGFNSKSGDKSYYCEDVLKPGQDGMWVAVDGGGKTGYQRDFDCFFRGWADKDEWLGNGEVDYGPPICHGTMTWEKNRCVENPWGEDWSDGCHMAGNCDEV